DSSGLQMQTRRQLHFTLTLAVNRPNKLTGKGCNAWNVRKALNPFGVQDRPFPSCSTCVNQFVMVSGKFNTCPPFVDSMLMVLVAPGLMAVFFSLKSKPPAVSTAIVPRTGEVRFGPLWMVMVLPGPGILAVPLILHSPVVRNWACAMVRVSGATTFTVTVAGLLARPLLSLTV